MEIKERTKAASLDAALTRLRSDPTIDVPTTMRVMDLGSHTVRAAIARGDIESLRVGRTIRVLSAPLRRQLGLE